MAPNLGAIGKEYPASEPYFVSRDKVREFARAVGETSPVCHDPEAARAAGYLDVIAPVTFAFVLAMESLNQVMFDPEVGLEYSLLVHGSERFECSRPITAGDEVVVRTRVSDMALKGTGATLTTEARLTTVAGEHLVTAYGVLVQRAAS